ncbi:MAG: hypothetical protein KGD57_06535 [Candidatus Lokiarchaeota archaeon]|nr:hypothetical protein [Candidatus Lokiarchaeota archaeon]
MQSSGLKIFRLKYRGSFESCEEIENPEMFLNYFSVVSILAIYIVQQKRLYIWVGKYVSESLKHYCAHVREIVSKNFPELRVLRNITMESKAETEDFFKSINIGGISITKEQLHKKIGNQENKLLPIISEIEELKTKADKYFFSEDYQKAIEISEKIIELGKTFDDKSIILDQEDFISEAKTRYIKTQLDLSLNEITILNQELIKSWKIDKYNEIISKIDNTLNIIKENDTENYKKKFEELKSDLIEFKKNNEEILNKIVTLESRINKSREKSQIHAAINNCEKIIKISEEYKQPEIKEKYILILNELKKELEEKNKKKLIESQQLINKAKELEKIIEVDENTLPLIEEFSVNDLFENLSKDVNEMLQQIGTLLEDHRVEIKNNIKTNALLISSSGETFELEKDIEIKKVNNEDEKLLYSANSGFQNPFDDIIEEAILTDLIPYNFEITNMKINKEEVKKLPEKTLTKEGLELTWKLKNIQPKENMDINYDLRRRVSRTIIFVLEDQLKIIKTHSNLNPLKLEGLFEAKIPFNNSYGKILDGLVIEDIIPLYYVNSIKEPKNILPSETVKTEKGDIIKWNIGNMENAALNYNYRLLELYKFEELKIKVKNLTKDGNKSLRDGNLTETMQNYDKIINELMEFNK